MDVKWTSFTAGPGVDHWNSDSESLEKSNRTNKHSSMLLSALY